jgi:F420-0:gamma-glutamyl ligase-like protein
MPDEDYFDIIINKLKSVVCDNDFVVLSEKALSVAKRNFIDESLIRPSLTAKIIARFWMRITWGYILAPICHLGNRLIQRLKQYPIEEGSKHKQVVLQRSGFWQALMWGSEAGIDGSNLPYNFVCLPLANSYKVAQKISDLILKKLNKKITAIVVDTDKTYTFRNFHFTHHPKPMRGIHSIGGWVAYLVGRAFKLKKRSTPLAVFGKEIPIEKALKIANIADRIRGAGSGATVWDMAARFKVKNNEVSWKMLNQLKHKPIVLLREKR